MYLIHSPRSRNSPFFTDSSIYVRVFVGSPISTISLIISLILKLISILNSFVFTKHKTISYDS